MQIKTSRTQHFLELSSIHLIRRRNPLGFLFVIITLALAYSALQTRFDPGFTKLIPLQHEYMQAFLEHSTEFTGANRVMVSLEWTGEGDIYSAEFMDRLRKATDEVFFTPGINRTSVRSLFTPEVRFIEVTEYGFTGGVVIPSRFTADEEGLSQVRSNVHKSGQVGNLVANDLRSAMVQAELLETDPETGMKTDYAAVASHLERIRSELSGDGIEIQIIGFAKVMGDVMDGLMTVILFFAVTFVITFFLLWAYSRSLKLTLLSITGAMLPVIWLLGILPLIGYGIDPMSILVPFLIFSIGVSHAVQMTNAWKLNIISGMPSIEAAQSAFRKLAIPGIVALLSTALGFMVMMMIDIPIVHELGVTACLGVGVMILTNKMFMPIVLSHLKLEKVAHEKQETEKHPLWWKLSALATPRPALISLGIMLVLLAGGTWKSQYLITGDIGSGVPELRDDSRYNQDNAKIAKNYSINMDVLSVYIETDSNSEACLDWQIMNAVDRFDFHMRGVTGVQSVSTVAGMAKMYVSGNNEGNPLWRTLQRSPVSMQAGSQAANPELGLNNELCRVINAMVYLTDHQNTTLRHVVSEINNFINNNPVEGAQFRLAGGNAGVAFATNEAVDAAKIRQIAAIFGVITLLCWVTFGSRRGVLCVIIPLTLVTILCQALMAMLGIGLKVSTLPMITLGVGVGVDYGIYIYEQMQKSIDKGNDLRTSFYEAMRQRGTAALFTAVTMTIGVGMWAFSPLKFQADMGILLSFMFLVNVLGAIFLLPAMACWLTTKSESSNNSTMMEVKSNPIRHTEKNKPYEQLQHRIAGLDAGG